LDVVLKIDVKVPAEGEIELGAWLFLPKGDVADLALAAYERALEPKRLALIPGGISIPISTSFRSRQLPQQNGFASIYSIAA
jgi:hypothetical protein